MGKLQGKVAIVTGASQGCGYGAALAMAREGASITLVSRTRAKLEAVADEIAAIGGHSLVHPADVRDRGSSEGIAAATIARFGRIDILVCAAQSPEVRTARLADIDDADIEALWTSGAVATLALMRAVRPHMIEAKGGSIINFASACMYAPQYYGVYAGVKAAIQAISRAAAVEWAQDGIRVNVVMPMAVSPSAAVDFATAEGREEQTRRAIPLGRIGDPTTDIGQPIAFLASGESGFITGSTFALDGGLVYVR